MKTFEELNLSPEILKAIMRLGFQKPTLIQEKAIPHVMDGEDVLGESATGSGKTLAFGCGVVQSTKPGEGLQSLILAPTRELAEQVKDDLKELSHHKKLKIIPVYGGVSINNQIDQLKTAEAVIATPGRLLDHIRRKTINLRGIKLLVLDEADRMFDMGFIEDVERIISYTPQHRQTICFSATLSRQIIDLADKYMREPVEVYAEKMVDPSKMKQAFYDIDKNQKLSLLVHLIKSEPNQLAMVFCNTRSNTDFVVKNLKANDVKAIAIHGGQTQNKRQRTIEVFDKGKAQALVCTDVASRGLHIQGVTHIYNYDIPNDPTDYVHRIGRTARAGQEGKVVNLLCHADYQNFQNVNSRHPDYNIERADSPQTERIKIVKTEQNRSGGGRRGFQKGRGPRSRGPANNRGKRPQGRGPRRNNSGGPRRSFGRR